MDEFASTYSALVGRIREKSPDAALVCVGVWPDYGQDYDAEIETACHDRQGSFVPIRDLWSTEGMRGPAGVPTPHGESDTFHPNDAGHRAIADRILNSIR